MPELTKRKLLQAQMTAYQQLREKISQRRAADEMKSAAAAPAASAPAIPAASAPITAAMLAQAMAELKEFIRQEMATLRRQMKTGPSR
jgi:3-oxoacyl-ACP reductase-like protein